MNAQATKEDLESMSIYRLMEVVKNDWSRPYFGALPYIAALMALTDNGYYEEDSWQCLAVYFLANARTWRGPLARDVKVELNRRLKKSQGQLWSMNPTDQDVILDKKE